MDYRRGRLSRSLFFLVEDGSRFTMNWKRPCCVLCQGVPQHQQRDQRRRMIRPCHCSVEQTQRPPASFLKIYTVTVFHLFGRRYTILKLSILEPPAMRKLKSIKQLKYKYPKPEAQDPITLTTKKLSFRHECQPPLTTNSSIISYQSHALWLFLPLQ